MINRNIKRTGIMFLMAFLVTIISTIAVQAACVTPTENLIISSSSTLCQGTYNLADSDRNGAIRINANNIFLNCNGSTILGSSTSGTYGIFVAGSNVVVENCTVSKYYYGIFTSAGANSATVRRNTVSDISHSGILSYGNSNLNINLNTLNNASIYLEGNNFASVTNNKITCPSKGCGSSRMESIFMQATDDTFVANNTIDGSQLGMYIYQDSNNIVIKNNTITKTDRGVRFVNVNSARTSTVSHNNFINNNNNVDQYQLDIEFINVRNIDIINNKFLESVDASILLYQVADILVANNTFDLICINGRTSYLGNAQNEPCTAIMVKELFKTWCYADACSVTPYTYAKVSTAKSDDIRVYDNTFDDDTNTYLFLQGVTNVKHNLQNYWYKSFKLDDFADKEEFYVSNNWNEVRNTGRLYSKTDNSKSLYEGYEIADIFRFFGVKKDEMYFRSGSTTKSFSVTVYNLTAPYNDIRTSAGTVLASNVQSFTFTVAPSQYVEVGNYVADTVPPVIPPITIPNAKITAINLAGGINGINCSGTILFNHTTSATIRFYKDNVVVNTQVVSARNNTQFSAVYDPDYGVAKCDITVNGTTNTSNTLTFTAPVIPPAGPIADPKMKQITLAGGINGINCSATIVYNHTITAHIRFLRNGVIVNTQSFSARNNTQFSAVYDPDYGSWSCNVLYTGLENNSNTLTFTEPPVTPPAGSIADPKMTQINLAGGINGINCSGTIVYNHTITAHIRFLKNGEIVNTQSFSARNNTQFSAVYDPDYGSWSCNILYTGVENNSNTLTFTAPPVAPPIADAKVKQINLAGGLNAINCSATVIFNHTTSGTIRFLKNGVVVNAQSVSIRNNSQFSAIYDPDYGVWSCEVIVNGTTNQSNMLTFTEPTAAVPVIVGINLAGTVNGINCTSTVIYNQTTSATIRFLKNNAVVNTRTVIVKNNTQFSSTFDPDYGSWKCDVNVNGVTSTSNAMTFSQPAPAGTGSSGGGGGGSGGSDSTPKPTVKESPTVEGPADAVGFVGAVAQEPGTETTQTDASAQDDEDFDTLVANAQESKNTQASSQDNSVAAINPLEEARQSLKEQPKKIYGFLTSSYLYTILILVGMLAGTLVVITYRNQPTSSLITHFIMESLHDGYDFHAIKKALARRHYPGSIINHHLKLFKGRQPTVNPQASDNISYDHHTAKKLQDYIERQKLLGFSNDDIKQALVNYGNSKKALEEVYKF